METKKSKHIPVGLTIDENVHREVLKYSAKTGIPISRIYSRGAVMLLNKEGEL